jgi:hypothetical protein
MFKERNRVLIPQAIADIGYTTPSMTTEGIGLGCSPIVAGDLNGDGRPDLVVNYEGYRSQVVIWRNDGNFQCTRLGVAPGIYAVRFDPPIFGIAQRQHRPIHAVGSANLRRSTEIRRSGGRSEM